MRKNGVDNPTVPREMQIDIIMQEYGTLQKHSLQCYISYVPHIFGKKRKEDFKWIFGHAVTLLWLPFKSSCANSSAFWIWFTRMSLNTYTEVLFHHFCYISQHHMWIALITQSVPFQSLITKHLWIGFEPRVPNSKDAATLCHFKTRLLQFVSWNTWTINIYTTAERFLGIYMGKTEGNDTAKKGKTCSV